MNKSLQPCSFRMCTNVGHCCHSGHCWNAPPISSLCWHPFGLYKHSASIVNGWLFFFFFFNMEELNYTPLFHLPFCVRHHFVRLPLFCIATEFNRILAGRFSLYCHTINICLWHYGPTYKGSTTFIAGLTNLYIYSGDKAHWSTHT